MDVNLRELTDDEDFIELVELVRRPRAQQTFRERPNHFDKWTNDEFKARFRLSKNVVRYLIIEIEDQISPKTKRYKFVLHGVIVVKYVHTCFFPEAMPLRQVTWFLLR